MLPLSGGHALRCSIRVCPAVVACRILTSCTSRCSSQPRPRPPGGAGPAPVPRLWGQPESIGKGDPWAARRPIWVGAACPPVDLALICQRPHLHVLTNGKCCPVFTWHQMLQGAASHTRCCTRQLSHTSVHLGSLHCPVIQSVMSCQTHSFWGYTPAWHPASSGAGRSGIPADEAGPDGAPGAG